MDIAVKMWQEDEDFRALYADQEFICLPHFKRLLQETERLPKRMAPAFAQETRRLSGLPAGSTEKTSPISAGCSTTVTTAAIGATLRTPLSGQSPT